MESRKQKRARKQMQNDYEKDLENIFVADFHKLLLSLYAERVSRDIERGIRAKKLKNNNETRWNPSSAH